MEPRSEDELVKGGKLGSGSFGEVRECRRGDNRIAVKLILINGDGESDQTRKTLDTEITMNEFLMKKVCNETMHVVKVLNIYRTFTQDGNFLNIEMELCEKSLFEHMSQAQKERRPITETDSIDIMMQILKGYEHLHLHGIVHRDLKPENILLKDGIWKIADFGLAKMLKGEERPLSYEGTLPYMSPEMLRNRLNRVGEKPGYDYFTDIWSLGVIMYYLLFGRKPWLGDRAQDILKAIEEKGLTFPWDTRTTPLLKKMLKIDRANRINLVNLRSELEALQNSEAKVLPLNPSTSSGLSPRSNENNLYTNPSITKTSDFGRVQIVGSITPVQSEVRNTSTTQLAEKFKNLLWYEFGKLEFLVNVVCDYLPQLISAKKYDDLPLWYLRDLASFTIQRGQDLKILLTEGTELTKSYSHEWQEFKNTKECEDYVLTLDKALEKVKQTLNERKLTLKNLDKATIKKAFVPTGETLKARITSEEVIESSLLKPVYCFILTLSSLSKTFKKSDVDNSYDFHGFYASLEKKSESILDVLKCRLMSTESLS